MCYCTAGIDTSTSSCGDVGDGGDVVVGAEVVESLHRAHGDAPIGGCGGPSPPHQLPIDKALRSAASEPQCKPIALSTLDALSILDIVEHQY